MKIQLSAVKTIFRFKAYTFINVIGLAVSVAASLIIVRYIHQEVTVDHFCKDLNQLYVLTVQESNGSTSIIDNENQNNDPNFIDPLKHPEVEKYSTCISFGEDYVMVGQHRYQANVLVTDSVFLQLMDYPTISGIKTIQRPDDAIISQKYARHIFGTEDPLGKQFVSSVGILHTVRGVVGEPSTKFSLQFDILVPIDQSRWSRMGFSIVRLVVGTNLQEYNEKVSKPQSLISYCKRPIQYMLLPLKDLYFNQTVRTPTNSFLRGSRDHVTVLSIVVCMLLLVGFFNFINIYTVIMLKRAREFGIKKVYGANGFQIFFQIYMENIYMIAASLLLIWMLIEVMAGAFVAVYDIAVKSNITFDISLSLILLFGLPLITTVYPFMRYNYSSPITSLRSINVGGNSIVSRALFLFIQYVITFCLIVVSLFFVRQLYTMLHADLGYHSKDIISCQFLSQSDDIFNKVYTSTEERQKVRDEWLNKVQIIKQKMDACPLFVSWEYGNAPINLEPDREVECNGEKHNIVVMRINKRYMDMFGFKLKEGREWDHTDQYEQYKLIINETARKMFCINHIDEASLQTESRLWWGKVPNFEDNPPFQVVGVIEDFRTGHLSKSNVPLAIMYYEEGSPTDPLMAAITDGKRKEAINFLRELHAEVMGKSDFNYTFVEDEIEKMYDEDKRITRIYISFAGLAICISCLGLFGLSLYDIRQRYREIALRKVNGATGRQIALLLMRKYLYILGTAFVLATPLAYYMINDYTKDFVVKAPIGVGVFVIGFILTLLISLGTLLWQVQKAVRLNPAMIMKND